MKTLGFTIAAASLALSSLAPTASAAELISCRLQNLVSYSLVRSDDGQTIHLRLDGLNTGHDADHGRFFESLGVPAASIPLGSLRAELDLPAPGTCLFPADPTTPQFTCEYQGPLTLTLSDLFGTHIADVPLGYLLIEQHDSTVSALRSIDGQTRVVTWKSYPVLFYARTPGSDGGPSLGGSWSNDGFTSDGAGHGGCTARLTAE